MDDTYEHAYDDLMLYDGFAGSPVGDEMGAALLLWPFWLIRWCWRKLLDV